MLKKWFISAFPEIEKISQNLGPNLGQKSLGNWLWLMKRCIGSANSSQNRFALFRKIFTMLKEVIHKRISWNRENISKSGPKLRLKNRIRNCIFNEKVHRIGTCSQIRFALFRKIFRMLNNWFICAFPEIEKISQNLGRKFRPKSIKNMNI